jgi:Type VI secretion system, TssN
MAIQFFLGYIGVFLAFAIALLFLVKPFSDGFTSGGKGPVIYSIISSFIVSVIAYASTFVTNHSFATYWIISGVFLLFGIVHITIVNKKYFNASGGYNGKIIIGEILFGLSIIFFAVVIFSSLQYFLSADKQYLFYPMLFSCIAFFIPVLVLHTFDAAFNIPAAAFTTWVYPLNSQIDLPDENPSEKLYVIGFEIAKKSSDVNKTYFRAKAPEGMKLGELYYHFINDYNELQSETPIEYTMRDSKAFEWWFRRRPKWYQLQHIFNPEITIRENGIQENTVIICERVESKN